MTTVVMAHGAFCGGWAFERFRAPFEALGWRVEAPDLRDGALAGRSMRDYADRLVAVCADLPERPVLVGHSMGGLVCQMAARRIQPRALVLLAPSPPWGVHGSSVEEAVTALGVSLIDPFWAGTVEPDLTLVRRFSLDRLPPAEREAAAGRMGPESGRAIREVLNWWLDPFMTTSVGPGPLGAPALVIAGERDQVHPPATARQTAERIGAAFEIMPGMSHWLIGEPGWDAVAARALRWLEAQERAAA
jgi:pimeloyl-ACP methyl ester carboxylesterase